MDWGCEQNEKPLKEALVITKNNLEDQAYNAIYNTPISFTYQNKDTGGRTNTSYQKALDRQRKMGKPVSDADKDKMVKELIPFLAHLYKKHLKAIIKEGSINELNRELNLKVSQLLKRKLNNLKPGSSEHQFAVKHILIGALRDANFRSESKKVASLFPTAIYNGSDEEKLIEKYEYEVGPTIASLSDWDGTGIVDAIGFYVSMTIGRPLGEKIEKLVESKLTISKFIKENIRITKNGDVLLKTKG
jgi:hypothetical protein